MNAIKSIFPQRLVKSLLTAGMFCMGISACADDTAAPEGSFSIADISELERFYDSYANKRIELPGSGYESGDIVQFIDTGISHNTYTMQYEQTGDGLLVTLPDNLASSGNSLLSMIMQLSMSVGVTIAGLLLGMYGQHHLSVDTPVAHQVFMYTYLSMAVIIALPAFIFARVPDDTSKNVVIRRGKRSGS